MRPEKAENIINKIFKKLYNKNHVQKYHGNEIEILNDFRKTDALRALHQLVKEHVKYEKNDVFPMDYYPYVITDEHISCYIGYISDRWRCAGRLLFMLRILGEDYMQYITECRFDIIREDKHIVMIMDKNGKVSVHDDMKNVLSYLERRNVYLALIHDGNADIQDISGYEWVYNNAITSAMMVDGCVELGNSDEKRLEHLNRTTLMILKKSNNHEF